MQSHTSVRLEDAHQTDISDKTKGDQYREHGIHSNRHSRTRGEISSRGSEESARPAEYPQTGIYTELRARSGIARPDVFNMSTRGSTTPIPAEEAQQDVEVQCNGNGMLDEYTACRGCPSCDHGLDEDGYRLTAKEARRYEPQPVVIDDGGDCGNCPF